MAISIAIKYTPDIGAWKPSLDDLVKCLADAAKGVVFIPVKTASNAGYLEGFEQLDGQEKLIADELQAFAND